MILSIILLILLAFICVYASMTDIKNNIIANKKLLIFALAGGIVDIIYYINYPGLLQVFIFNFALMCICSVALYATHVWAAGDSKMLIVIAMLIPASSSIYAEGYLFEILIPIYAFALSFAYLIINTLYLQVKNKYRLPIDDIKKQYKTYLKRLVINSVYIVTLVKVENYIFKEFNLEAGVFQIVINVFALFLISNIEFLQKNKVIIIFTLIASVIFSLVTGMWIINASRLLYYFMVAVFILLRIIIGEYNYEQISVENLKPGMILSTYTTMLFSESRVKGLPSLSTEDLRSRLTKDEVEAVKRWQKSKYGLDQVTIVKKIPFAIFLTIGVVIYMILGVYLRCTLI